jgi:anhydro-N-acetylmuramic acid kinase
MSKIEIIGIMSGTSLDGVDIAHVSFTQDAFGEFNFSILNTKSFDFPPQLHQDLVNATNIPVPVLMQLDKKLGLFYADCVNDYLSLAKVTKANIHAIACHGQTIYHQPENGFTLQIGCGTTIAFHTGIQVINDFRTKDIVAGGQGAPLVPIGDFNLFQSQAESFLNIGGFANISFKENGIIKAFDICPGNLPLNKLIESKGLTFDNEGEMARSGEINFFLLDLLNSLPFYVLTGPKSLGTEWLEEHFYPLLKFDKEIENNLRTVVEHIAFQIGNSLNSAKVESVMISGGGTKNKFLIERIAHYYNGKIVIPSEETISFKEAIIFAFLGALYLQKIPNCIQSVTGASCATIGGTLHIPN